MIDGITSASRFTNQSGSPKLNCFHCIPKTILSCVSSQNLSQTRTNITFKYIQEFILKVKEYDLPSPVPVYLQEPPNILPHLHTRPFITVPGLMEKILKWQISWKSKELLVNWNVTLILNVTLYFPWSKMYVVDLEICAVENIWYFSTVVHESVWQKDWFLNWMNKFLWTINLFSDTVILHFLQFFSYYWFTELHFLSGGICSSWMDGWCPALGSVEQCYNLCCFTGKSLTVASSLKGLSCLIWTDKQCKTLDKSRNTVVAVVVQRYNGSEAYREDESFKKPRFQPKTPKIRNLKKISRLWSTHMKHCSYYWMNILIFKVHMPECIYFRGKLSKTLCIYSLIPALIQFAMS